MHSLFSPFSVRKSRTVSPRSKKGIHSIRMELIVNPIRAKKKPQSFFELLQDSPVIAAVKSEDGLEKALTCECAAVFILNSTILNVTNMVQQVKASGKLAFVHADLVDGLAARDIAADFLTQATQADGIISTRPNLIRRAKELDLITIQRFFLLDSLAFDSVLRQSSNADIIDILPGTMPRVIERLTKLVHQPVIASGLLVDKQDVMGALSAGALAVSTTCEPLWFA